MKGAVFPTAEKIKQREREIDPQKAQSFYWKISVFHAAKFVLKVDIFPTFY